MKKVFLVCLIYLFSLTSAFANDRDIRLNQLFNELKVNKAKVAAIVEQEIWSLWSTHPTDEKLTARLEAVSYTHLRAHETTLQSRMPSSA